MQNDIFATYEEVEPRKMPKPASKFDSRPFPMVPEVSLIMDKPHQSSRMNDTVANSIPELRSFRPNDSPYRSSESYASWKEKQFPQQKIKISPNRFHSTQIHSSTQNISGPQDTHSYKHSGKLCNPLDCKDYYCKHYSSDSESPRRYSSSKRSERIETPNKYTLSHASSYNEIDHHGNNAQHYSSRSRSRDERVSPNDRRRSDHSRAVETYDARQKPRIHRSSSCSNADSYAQHHRSRPMEYEYESRHSRSLQPVHHYRDSEPSHHSGCCSSNHNKSTSETETVKNLLQVITSQNEQIKNLQKQVERLLKLHEQSIKERNQCTCQTNGIVYQNAQLYDQSRTANLPIGHNNFKDNERCFPDMKLQDEKTQKTIVEQKVSIGVMTSFELKVQNNPSLAMDNESKQRNNQEKMLPNLETSNMIKNLVNDTEEMIRKKPNFFMPTPLENISEASESHMSSLRQSHLCSDTTRQSIEAQDSIEIITPNFHRQNYQDNERGQRNTEPKQNMNASGDKNSRLKNKVDYNNKELDYERAKNDVQEVLTYQYNYPYENVRSSPHTNVHSSPHKNLRSSPHTNVRSSPHENLRSSPHENLHSSPHENFRSSPHENLRSSPHENLRFSPHENLKEKSDEYHVEPIIADIPKMKNTGCNNYADECLSLSSSELDVEDPSPPSPEPSIHLDMQEYSSEGGSLPPQRQPKIGWTLYNNVLDQVNQILQNSSLNGDIDDDDDEEEDDDDDEEQPRSNGMKKNEKKEYENNVIMDTVKAATLEQLTKLGISFSDNVEQREPNYNKKVMFDAYYARQRPEAHIAATSASIETNTSMHMKALAMKYLNDEQLADMAMQKPRPGSVKQAPGNVPNTNMSFATMHYLQRYHLLPGNNSSPMREPMRDDYKAPEQVFNERRAMKVAERREPSPQRYFTGTSKVSYPSKILDISTLKQQPKLL